MERLSKAEIGWKGIVSSIEAAIKGWQPSALKSERAYSNALADYLRAALPVDARVEREYRHEGTTCDICVLYSGLIFGDRVLIELKRNLGKKADYNRLVGQVEELKPKKNKIIVVLVGDTDPVLLGRLKEQFKSYLDDFFSGDVSLRIVVVT